MDDARPTVTRGRATLRAAAALAMAVLLAAHVGSPDVFYSGNAGPYAIDVVVRPPQVVPGIAEVIVHASDARVSRVVVRPVYWRAGSRGAPPGDAARPVAGSPGTYAGQLWLMATGPYTVSVAVIGSAGSGSVSVPVAAVATGQLGLNTTLRWLLAALGTLLCAGIVTAVRAAVGESQVPPGESISPERRRRARIATLVTLPIVALIVFGGARWWDAEARAYRRTLDRPLATHATVTAVSGQPTLVVEVMDSLWRAGARSPLMPDHGKLAHLFLARRDSLDVFAHLHPVLRDSVSFTTALPPLPVGRYRVYVDIVHQNGLQRTLTDSFTIAAPLGAGGSALGDDDAWFDGPAARSDSSSPAPLGAGATIAWIGDARPVVGRTGVLRFALRDSTGAPVLVEPYLGMSGHAVVMRRDGGVFVHLHPGGTASMASEEAMRLRDQGDTTADGSLRLDSLRMAMARPAMEREIDFPYAFPSAGSYRVWVQLRIAGAVRTAAVDVAVAPATTDSAR